MKPFLLSLLLLLLAACGGDEATTTTGSVTTTTTTTTTTAPASTAAGEGCAHVVDATITLDGELFTVAATVSSTETGWDKYADAWEVRDPSGTVLGERVLAHPHENEQPFTRNLSGVAIPDDVDVVTIAARDSVLGFCGDVFEVEVPQR